MDSYLERARRGGVTEVPMRRGFFMAAQREKWERVSSSVRSPLPTVDSNRSKLASDPAGI